MNIIDSLSNIFQDTAAGAELGAQQGFWTGIGSIPEVQQGVKQSLAQGAQKYEPYVIIGLIILVILLLMKGGK